MTFFLYETYSKAGLDPTKVYTGHQTHISSLSFHPGMSPLSSTGGHADFSDLVLTSSFDWTVKLWKIKVLSQILPTICNTHTIVLELHGSNDWLTQN